MMVGDFNLTLFSPTPLNVLVLGYSWCVETIKSSMYAPLAAELDLNKAVMFLKQDDIPQAVETLKYFERKEGPVAVNAAINLTFIYLLVSFGMSAVNVANIIWHLSK